MPLLSAARAPERSDSQVKKNGGRAYREIAGNGADPRPALPEAQSEEDCEQKEECPGGFEPYDAANAAEGTEKAANTFADVAPGFCCDARGGFRLGASWRDEARGGGDGLRFGRWRIRRGRRGADNSLACNSAGDANADAESAADVSRFHTVYDGSSGSRCFSRFGAGQGLLLIPALELLSILNGSKVKRFRVSTRILFARVRRSCSRSWR